MSTLLLLTLTLIHAEDGSLPDLEKQRQAEVILLAKAKAKQLTVLVGDARGKLVERPLLRWSNPTAGSVYGEVYLWTHAQRPVAVASIYRWFHPFKDANAESVSLSDQPLTARDGDTTIWNAKTPDALWRKLPEFDKPAASPAGRLQQMRSLAKNFTAHLSDSRGGDTTSRELRLLQQPAHRYSASDAGILDGGLFAFVEVTDPEAWLLLEAVETDGEASWRYLVARMNADALEMRFNGKLIHQWDKLEQPWKQRTGAYTLWVFDPAKVPVEPSAKTELP